MERQLALKGGIEPSPAGSTERGSSSRDIALFMGSEGNIRVVSRDGRRRALEEGPDAQAGGRDRLYSHTRNDVRLKSCQYV